MTHEENKKILSKHKGKFLWKFIISILLNVLLLIIPLFYSKLIDSLSIIALPDIIYYLAFFAFLTILYRFIEYFNQKAYFALYLSLYKSYMNLGLMKTFDNSLHSLSRFSLSEYSNIMSEDFEMISDYYSTLVIRIVEILEFIYIIIYFFFINQTIGLITLVASLIIVFLLFYFNKNISKTNTERKLRNDKRISLFQEIFLSVKNIKGFNILKNIRKRLNNLVDDYIHWHIKLNMSRFGLREVTLGILDVFKIISLIIGIRLIIKQEMTLGVITIIYSYYAKLNELFISIITLSESFNNKEVSTNRVYKLFQYAKNHEVDISNYNDIKGEIGFVNILYGDKKNPLLKDVSFYCSPNSFNVLCGNKEESSGIFDLLLGYNKAHTGKIYLDKVDINEYSQENISHNMAFVMEYPTFFHTSIRDNLILFDANFENIINVCKKLKINQKILSLENGYEEILTSNADNLDNDVKYLLAVSRVFLKKSKIILINNILDHVSKNVYKEILSFLVELKKEHTIIMISNDLKIIKNPFIDKIIMIHEGKIIGEGLHKDLIENNKEYRKILKNL